MDSKPLSDVLVLSPTPTWPLNYGNRKRIYSVCKSIQEKGSRIHFLFYPGEVDWREDLPFEAQIKMSQQWDSLYIIPPSTALHPFAKNKDHTIDEWWDKSIGDYLKWIFNLKLFDAFIVNYTWLSKAFEYVPSNIFKVLDTHDRFSDRRLLLEENGIKAEFFHTTPDQEKLALERADLVWAIKSQEKIFFETLTSKPIIDTLIHVDLHKHPRSCLSHFQQGYLRLGFIGAANNINRVNIEQFLELAIPLFKKHFAPIKIVLAGGLSIHFKNVDSRWVESIGRVDEVSDFYQVVDAVVIPMVFSTGLKIKFSEALSFGIPIISHHHASEGFHPMHSWHELPSMQELINTCIDLAFSPEKLPELMCASIESQKYHEDAFSRTIENFLDATQGPTQTLLLLIDEDHLNEKSVFYIRILDIIEKLSSHFRLLILVKSQGAQPNSINLFSNDTELFFMMKDGDIYKHEHQVNEDFNLLLNSIDDLSIWVLEEELARYTVKLVTKATLFIDIDFLVLEKAINLFNHNNSHEAYLLHSDNLIYQWQFNQQFLLPLTKEALNSHYTPFSEGGKTVILFSGDLKLYLYFKNIFDILIEDYSPVWITTSKLNISPELLDTPQFIKFEDVCFNRDCFPGEVSLFLDLSSSFEMRWIAYEINKKGIPNIALNSFDLISEFNHEVYMEAHHPTLQAYHRDEKCWKNIIRWMNQKNLDTKKRQLTNEIDENSSRYSFRQFEQNVKKFKNLNEKEMTIYFHLGMPKTASSYIQRMLKQNAEELLKEGYYYCPKGLDHCEEVTMICDDSTMAIKGIQDFINIQIAEAKILGADKIIISSECLFQRPNDIIRSITDVIPKTQAILFWRRQDEFLESAWQQWHYKNKKYKSFNHYISCFKQLDNWFDKTESWNENTTELLKISFYEKINCRKNDIFLDFLDMINFHDISNINMEFITKDCWSSNKSFNSTGMDLLFTLREYANNDINDHQAQKLIFKIFEDEINDKQVILLEDAARIKLIKKFKEQNARLINKYDTRHFFEYNFSKKVTDKKVDYESLVKNMLDKKL